MNGFISKEKNGQVGIREGSVKKKEINELE
jgi:hypothetical protein